MSSWTLQQGPYEDPNVWRSIVGAIREDLGLSGLRERALRDHVMVTLSAEWGTAVTPGMILGAAERRRAREVAGEWWLAWRVRVLGEVVGELLRRYHGGGSIGTEQRWPLPGFGAPEPVSGYCHPGTVTVTDELRWWTAPWTGDLQHVEWACAATGAVPSSRDGLVTATQRVLDWSWYFEAQVEHFEGWDDSCWCDYLGVRELMPWVVVALAPGPSTITVPPREYGDIAWNVAHELTSRDDQWRMPQGVAEAIADALTAVGWGGQ